MMLRRREERGTKEGERGGRLGVEEKVQNNRADRRNQFREEERVRLFWERIYISIYIHTYIYIYTHTFFLRIFF